MNQEQRIVSHSKMKVRCDDNGVHFFDRESGLNILFDEIDVPKVEHDWAPRFVSIALTNACDLQCHFCYAPKHAARLEVEQLIAWAIALDQGGCLGLGFGGGEPTLHPHFASICQRVTMATRLAVSFTTHGHRLTDQMADQLAGSVNFVRVSVDGIEETYSRIRGRRFSTLLEKLRIVRTIAPFGVNYVVNANTIQDLDRAAAIAFGHGATEMLLLPERSVAGKGGIDGATKRSLEHWIRRQSQYRLAISDSPTLTGVPTADPFHDVDGLTGYAHIDASGRLYASSFSNKGVTIREPIDSAIAELRREIGVLK